MAEEIVMSNENKIRVGKLIRIYQKEKGITLFELVENVCSRQVATNFNKGIPAKNDEFYLDTLAKLGFSYNYMHDMDDYILRQSKRLRDAVEWYDTKLMEEICKETIEQLKPYSKYIIEYEYIRAFEAIYKFHFINIKIEEETKHFLETMDYLNKDIVDVIKDIIFRFCFKFYGLIEGTKDFSKTKELLKQLDLHNTSYNVNKLNYAVYLLSLKYHFDSLKLLSEVEEEYYINNNYNGLLIVYMRKFWLIENIQDKSIEDYIYKFDHLIESQKEKLDSYLVLKCMFNLAISCFEVNNYLAAKQYFIKTLCFEEYYVQSAICLKFIAYYENDIILDFELKPINECVVITEREKIFYEYYRLKSSGAEVDMLIDYIDSYVFAQIGSHDSFYYKVFLNEVKCLFNIIDKKQSLCKRKLVKIFDKIRNL